MGFSYHGYISSPFLSSPVPVQAKVKTDARFSYLRPNYHLSAAHCLGGGGDDDAGDDNGDNNDDYQSSPYIFLQ